ncbi:MAG: biotin/lipoate--protein ligase family protein [Beijerinckiaceae bacterium]
MSKPIPSDEKAAPEVFGAGDGDVSLDLPPGFEAIVLREGGDAFVYAQQIAAQRGAGTLVWVQRFDLVEFAVVLEPEEPLATARRALYAGMAAMADSLAVHCPPEKPIHFNWPDAMLFDHGLIGGGRLAWPENAAEDQPPEWLVFGGMMRTAVVRNAASGVSLEPGTWSVGTSLEVEGFEEINSAALVESFARHLMRHVSVWLERGFPKMGREWLARLPEDKAIKRGIDANGDMLVHSADAPSEAAVRHDLVSALAKVDWYDQESQEPKL